MMRTISVTVTLMLLSFMTGTVFSAERPQRVKQGAAPGPAPAASAPAPTVLSIIPAQIEPGMRVMIYGSGFGERASVFLGSVEIPAKITDGRQAEFTVPAQMEAGLYALYVKRADGSAGRVYNFTVLPLRPVLNLLAPDHINSCAQGGEREVTAQGQNFTEHSQLFFDGAVIRSTLASPDALTFSVPQVAGGLHQVMVKNSSENASAPMALAVDTKPEISQITVGNEYVNYYELLIEGRNFQQNSSIYVDGMRVGGRGGQETLEQREKLIYIDCTRLIYQRHPYSPVNKDFRLQVVNQGGEGSQVVNVTAP